MAWFNISAKTYQKPLIASFDVTYKCNLECDMCFVKGFEKFVREDEILSTGEIIEATKKIHENYRVSHFRFLGGEPLIRHDLPEIIAAISPWATTEITTNGLLLTEKLCHELISAGVSNINVSIDGPKENSTVLRGHDAYEKALAGLDNLLHVKKSLNSMTPSIKLCTIVTKLNFKSIEEVMILARDKGVKWDFWPLHNILESTLSMYPHHLSQNTQQLMLSEWEQLQFWWDYYRLKLRYTNTNPTKINFGFIRPILYPLYKLFAVFFHTSCNRVRSHLIVGPHGELFPCEYLRPVELGSIRDLGKQDIWFSPLRKAFYNDSRCAKITACNECNKRGTYRGNSL
ncbi:MAG: radical SAM protein [Methylococcales bacterium]